MWLTLFDAAQVLGALGGRLENENQALFGGWAGGPGCRLQGSLRERFTENTRESRALDPQSVLTHSHWGKPGSLSGTVQYITRRRQPEARVTTLAVWIWEMQTFSHLKQKFLGKNRYHGSQ